MKEETICFVKGRISVIIPTYNREKLVCRSIRSVLSQEGDYDIEVIVVDDGSSDRTGQVVSEMDDERVRYFPIDHQGACAARNLGLDQATGEFIAFQDSDDVWIGNKLRQQMELMKRTDADVVFCAYQYHDEKNHIEGMVPSCEQESWISFERLLEGNMMGTCTMLGKRKRMGSVRFDPSLPRWQDWDYALQLTQTCSVYYSPEILVNVYVQGDSISKRPVWAIDAACILLRKYSKAVFVKEKNLDGILKALKHHVNEQESLLARANTENEILQKANREKQREINALKERIVEEKREKEFLSLHLKDVLESRAWKAGRMITYIPRHIHNLFLKKRP